MFKSYWKMDHMQMYDKHWPHRSVLLFTSVAYVHVLTQQDEEISAAWLFDSVSQLWVVEEASSGSGSSSMNMTPCSLRGLLRFWGTTQKHHPNFTDRCSLFGGKKGFPSPQDAEKLLRSAAPYTFKKKNRTYQTDLYTCSNMALFFFNRCWTCWHY